MEVIKKLKMQLETLKVLIADDDPPTRILLRAAISQWGYEVVEAKDGEEAWEILQKENSPQLLILDWLMPKLDGIALCARIKQQSNFQPYVILLTQMTGTTNIVKGLEAGADEFLSKPFNMAELRSRLSVGARIIKYKTSVEERNKELQYYSSHLEEVVYLMLNFSKNLDEFFKMQDVVILQKVQELQNELQKIIQSLKAINSNHDER